MVCLRRSILGTVVLFGLTGLAACGEAPQAVEGRAAAVRTEAGHHIPLATPPFDFRGCGQVVHVEFPQSNEHVTTTTLPDGTVIQAIQGALKARLSVVATGAQVDLNVSGPGTTTAYPSGDLLFEGRGRSILFLPQAQAQRNNVPQIFVGTGKTDVLFGADGTITVQQVTGHLTDVCALLL